MLDPCPSTCQVREEAGRCLFMAAQAAWQLPWADGATARVPAVVSESSSDSPLVTAAMRPLLASLHQRYTTTAKHAEAEAPERKAILHEIEGVLYFFVHAVRVGQGRCCVSLLAEALPLLLAAKDDIDKEFIAVCIYMCIDMCIDVCGREGHRQGVYCCKPPCMAQRGATRPGATAP